MPCRDSKVAPGNKEEHVTEEGHQVGRVGSARVNACHDRLVVVGKQNLFGCPAMAPNKGGHDNGVKLLPLNAPGELLLRPPALEPFPREIGAKSNFPRAVSEELQVRAGGPLWQEHKAGPVPWSGKGPPPGNVPAGSV